MVMTGVTQLLQQLILQTRSTSNISVVESRLGTVEVRLENLGTRVEQLLQYSSSCSCNNNDNNNSLATRSEMIPVDLTTAQTEVIQPTLQLSTKDITTGKLLIN